MTDHFKELRENLTKQHAELVKSHGKECADRMLEKAVALFTRILLGGIEYTDPRPQPIDNDIDWSDFLQKLVINLRYKQKGIPFPLESDIVNLSNETWRSYALGTRSLSVIIQECNRFSRQEVVMDLLGKHFSNIEILTFIEEYLAKHDTTK